MRQYQNIDVSKLSLAAVLASFGYEIDAKEGKRPLIMRRKADDGKVAIYQNPSNQRFLNLRDDSRGDAIQFVQNELSCDFIRAKEYILSITDTDIKTYGAERQQMTQQEYKPRLHWQQKYDQSLGAETSEYLVKERGLLPGLLVNCKDVRASKNGTPLFFNRNASGFLTACEYRKPEIKAYDKGSQKSLFFVNHPESGQLYIVVCESAIDALSFAQLLILSNANLEQYLIIAHSGTPNNYQCEQILQLAQKGKRRVILAQDNDDKGDEHADKLAVYLSKNSIQTKRKKPNLKDWNDQLRCKN